MTKPNQLTLDEILLQHRGNIRLSIKHPETRGSLEMEAHREAKQQLSQLINGIIGEEIIEAKQNPFKWIYRDSINGEHDEQRQRAKDMGVDL